MTNMTRDADAGRMEVPSAWRGPAVGACVGLTDVAFVFPLAVLATRRENGQSLRAALARGNLHAGAATAATLLLPYSMVVETLSAAVRRHGSRSVTAF